MPALWAERARMTRHPDRHDLTTELTVLMAIACGAMVGNLYYAQTLVDAIGPEVGLSSGAAGGIVTLTQLGYGAGLALIVPLSDLIENKRLVIATSIGAILGALGVALSTSATAFLAFSLLTGICSVGAQVLVPLAAHLSSHDRQGRSIGLVMSGLLTGIMLARPLASLVAGVAGWRWVFLTSAILMTLVTLALLLRLPPRKPAVRLHYGQILGSMVRLMRDHRQLRLRAAYQSLMFVCFNLFWTAAPLVLLREMKLSQGAVALFALAGAGGALTAPVAGRLADRGHARAATACAFVILALSFLAADMTVAAGSVIAFAVTAVLIDGAVQLCQISGQRIIYSLEPRARGRVNASYMTIVFVIGGMGSLVGSATYRWGGWTLSGLTGAALGGLALLILLLFDRKR